MLISEKKLRLIIRQELLREQTVDVDVDLDTDDGYVPDVVSIKDIKPKPIAKGVRTNHMIMRAWTYLSPHLPEGAYMSSALRTQDEQDAIICMFAKKNNIPCDVNDSNSLDDATKQLQAKKIAIGRRVGRKKSHASGEVFDITGAPLSKIKQAVEHVTNDPTIPIRFAEFGPYSPPYSLVEPNNNAVHVIIEPSGFKVAAVRDD